MKYEQKFSFDTIGNMTQKKSEETITPAIQKKGGDDLNYEFTYENDADYAHRLKRAGSEQKGWRYYTYDANSSETLYFNTMWTWHTDTGLRDGQYSKHIYLGETRVVTKQTSKLEASYGQSDEWHHQYYYHPDHLGSAQLVTDYEGNEYQRIEYTPYGELWVEKKTEKEEGLRYLPYKFTAKEMDEETGLYYYGARYLDAKYSRWMSADPAVSDYIPMAPVNDEARKHNQSLPGMGGVYNNDRFFSKGLTPSTEDGEWQKQFDGPVKQIEPSSKNTKEFEANILAAVEKYQNASNYAALPKEKKKTTNSNSFAFSILRNALSLDKLVFTTPEGAKKLSEDYVKTKPSVSKWRVPGWDSGIGLE